MIRMKWALAAVCTGILIANSHAVAETDVLIAPVSALDRENISISRGSLTGGGSFEVRIPLREPLNEIEAVTWSMPTLTEAVQAFDLIRSQTLKSVQVNTKTIVYHDLVWRDPCKEQGLEDMSIKCMKLKRESQKEALRTTETVERCTKTCSIRGLNF